MRNKVMLSFYALFVCFLRLFRCRYVPPAGRGSRFHIFTADITFDLYEAARLAGGRVYSFPGIQWVSGFFFSRDRGRLPGACLYPCRFDAKRCDTPDGVL